MFSFTFLSHTTAHELAPDAIVTPVVPALSVNTVIPPDTPN